MVSNKISLMHNFEVSIHSAHKADLPLWLVQFGWSPHSKPIRADAIMQTTDYSDVTTYLTVQCLSIMQDFMILNNYLPWCCNVLICIYCISYKVIHSFINFVSGKQTDDSAAVTSLPLLSVGDCRCMIYINNTKF